MAMADKSGRGGGGTKSAAKKGAAKGATGKSASKSATKGATKGATAKSASKSAKKGATGKAVAKGAAKKRAPGKGDGKGDGKAAARQPSRAPNVVGAGDDPLWFKDAIIYELHVRAFHDSDGDGIGDFKGLTQKLDFLADLGVTALWLLPFYPSPLRDDGYDIAEYKEVNPSYGTLDDFREFLNEAHARGLKVITELVINHTSDQHAWFQRARKAPKGSPERDFYVWSDTAQKWEDARIIFKDFEHSNWTWDHEAEQYYWHRFYSHQPDLNYENPAVMEAVYDVLDFWMGMGVDGMRLDAVPYLIEREGTNCENLPETHEILKQIRAHMDDKHQARMLLAEANQWPEDAAEYFGDGDECHMNFHFPLMPRLFMAVQQEDRFPIIDILDQTPEIPENCQWAIFLRNHDELTLEMVTDEERDYMYRTYASDPKARINLGIRRRLAPLLANNRRKIELMNGLLFSLPGTPVLYYGDEIGMGDNFYLGDRNGVRTPMQWSGDRNAGFSRANPQRLFLPVIIDPEYHFEAINVETQQANPSSLLWWMKRLIGLRKRFQAFGRGELNFLYPDNRKVLAFTRQYEDETILVIANLSRFTQAVEIDLSQFSGTIPIELMGRNAFPPIGERPYFFTLGPHSFHWFALEPERPATAQRHAPGVARDGAGLPVLRVDGEWTALMSGRGRSRVEALLPDHIAAQRWFRSKARTIRSIDLEDVARVEVDELGSVYVCMAVVDYVDEDAEHYLLPLGFVTGERAARLLELRPGAALARLETGSGEGVLIDALAEPHFAERLLALIAGNEKLSGSGGDLVGRRERSFDAILDDARERAGEDERIDLDGEGEEPWRGLRATVSRLEQSNTSVSFGATLILKLYRRVEPGINADVEIGEYLTRQGFDHAPRVAGTLSLRRGRSSQLVLGMLQEFVPNEGDAWQYTLDRLGDYFERNLAEAPELPEERPTVKRLLSLASDPADDEVRERVGTYIDDAELLGRRTGEMHRALAEGDGDFAPEAFSTLYQRSLYQSLRNLTANVFELARTRVSERPALEDVLGMRDQLLGRFRSLVGGKLSAQRTRVHGDYHLGQVLYTGRDFVITDFEGEPARPASERRLRRSPLRDVAGMLRSFHYAAYSALARQREQGLGGGEASADAMADFWYTHVAAAFLRGYLDTVAGAGLVPEREKGLQVLLDTYLLEKAVYEVGYELNNRPDWVGLPVRGILQLMRDRS